MPRPLLVLVGLVTASAGAQAIDGVAIELQLDSDTATLGLEYRHEGDDALTLRRRVDVEAGNRDGVVEAHEVREFVRANLETRLAEACRAALAWLERDGAPPEAALPPGIGFTGLEGSIASTNAVTERITYSVTHPPTRGPDQLVRLGWRDLSPSVVEAGCGYLRGSHVRIGTGEDRRWIFSADRPRVTIAAAPGCHVDAGSISQALHPLWDGQGFRADSHADRMRIESGTGSFRLVTVPVTQPRANDAPAIDDVPSKSWWAAPVLLGASALVWRRWPLVAAFVRINRGRALLHPRRAEIESIVAASPGVALADLRHATGLGDGVLRYHVRVLERTGFLLSRKIGQARRLYPPNDRTGEPPPSAVQARILHAIEEAPGSTQTQLLDRLGMPRYQASYQLRRLDAAGRVRSVRRWRWRHYYPVPAREG